MAEWFINGDRSRPVIAHDRDGLPIAAGDTVVFSAWYPGLVPKGLVGTRGEARRVTPSGRLVVIPWSTAYGARKPIHLDSKLVKIWRKED